MTVLPPGTMIGPGERFRIESVLGEGAFGMVYKGTDTRLEGQPVAIKFLKEGRHINDEIRLRFRMEGTILAKLNHPHIVRILDIANDSSYIVLEFVPGGTLENRLERAGVLPIDYAVEILIGVLKALHVVHDESIWHRDLKPANILFDDHDTPKVTDFGIAHAPTDIRLVKSTTGRIGTPFYMSPEQARGEKINCRSDLWACGAVLFEIMTAACHLPQDGIVDQRTLLKVLESLTKSELQPPSTHNPDIPAELDQITMMALEPKAAQRYSTAKAMQWALTSLLEKDPVLSKIAQARRALRLAEPRHALETLEQLIKLPSPAADVVTPYANACIGIGRHDLALGPLEDACARKSPRPEWWRLWATCLRVFEQWDKALDVVTRGIQHHDKDVELLIFRANLFRAQGDTARARNDLKRAADLAPANEEARRLWLTLFD